MPEAPVQNAQRAILTQLISYGRRYSIGNPYEELSYAESLDAAEVAAEYGYSPVARSIIELSLQRMRLRPWRFTAFRGAHILSTAALYYRLTHDRGFLRRSTPALDRLVDRIAARQLPDGRLHDTRGPCRRLAQPIDRALRPAVIAAASRLPDGSLFVPSQLTTAQPPFRPVTATREGSYWNLVMPYAFSSGWFSRAESRGILRYLLGHGSRLLGVPRTYARTVYGRGAARGSRRSTYVSGEAVSSFGRVTFVISRRGRRIEARPVLPADARARLRLRLPTGGHLRRVVIGRTAVAADTAGTVDLGPRRGPVVVRATIAGSPP